MILSGFYNKMKTYQTSRGFTLIELLVTVAIIAIVSTLTIFQYREYTTNIDLKGQSNDIALALREAQVDATSGKEFSAGTNVFKIKYMVLFDTAAKSFNMYGDRNSNGVAEASEIISQYKLRNGYSMSLCVKASEAGNCISPTPTKLQAMYSYGTLSAAFKDTINNLTYPNATYPTTFVEVTISKTITPSKSELVRVWSTGRIEN
jgi:prepilin-type N-terminal cleavage/methylation domain-containing protein